MKKLLKFIALIIVFTALATVAFACGDDPTPEQKFKITFDYQGAVESDITEMEVSSSYTFSEQELPLPSKQGYAFGGWFSEPDGKGTNYRDDTETEYTFAVNPTFYAYWIPNEYKIIFDYVDAENGADISELPVFYMQPLGTLPAPEKAGYSFLGWFYVDSNEVETQYTSESPYDFRTDITLYARFALRFRIYFSYYGGAGDLPPYIYVNSGMPIGSLPSPTKSGYGFEGWFTDPDEGERYFPQTVFESDSDLTLHARWVADMFDITLNYYEATSGITTYSLRLTFDSVISGLPLPYKTGYIFGGWFSEPNGNGDKLENGGSFSIPSNITLHAYWTLAEYTIYLDYNGGTANEMPESIKVNYNSIIEGLPMPEKPPYTFGGWYYISGRTELVNGTEYPMDSSVDAVAVWLGTEGLSFSPIGNSVEVSQGTASGSVIIIPDYDLDTFLKVSYVASDAFKNNTELEQVVLPLGVTSIDDGAFYGCTSLSEINLENIRAIGSEAFRGCTSLQALNLNLTELGESAFFGCVGLETVALTGLSEIPAQAFEGCVSLENLALPSSISFIGRKAFYNCESLNFSSLPSGLLEIEEEAFRGCVSLSLNVFPAGLSVIGNGAFYDCGISGALVLNSGLIMIGDDAFNGCYRISSLTLNQGLLEIGTRAFYGISFMTLTIPASVENIGYQAFEIRTSVYFDNNDTLYNFLSEAFVKATALNIGVALIIIDDYREYYPGLNFTPYEKPTI